MYLYIYIADDELFPLCQITVLHKKSNVIVTNKTTDVRLCYNNKQNEGEGIARHRTIIFSCVVINRTVADRCLYLKRNHFSPGARSTVTSGDLICL